MEGNRNISDRQIAGQSIQEWKDTAEGYYEDLQHRFSYLDRQVRDLVNTRPLACVAGAFAIGFLFARTFRMWRR